MPAEDHLDRETSVSVELTNAGLTLKAKSRGLAAIDRLLGGVGEWFSVRLEKDTTARRLAIEAEQKIGGAAIDAIAAEIGGDPDFARRTLANVLRKATGEQANLDGVAQAAIEDLRREPPTEAEAASGPEELAAPFVNRFETYAREASTEELRERWGRVLASEIRKPGTFSQKALRIVDEIDADVAQLFERLSEHRLGTVLPKALVGELSFEEVLKLTSAELLFDPGLGQVNECLETRNAAGVELWISGLGEHAVGFAKSEIGDGFNWPDRHVLMRQGGKPAIPVYVLTGAGAAIASILPNNEEAAARHLAERFREFLPSQSVYVWKRDGTRWAGLT